MRMMGAALAVLLAMSVPALAEEDEWTYGTVTTEPKPSVREPRILTAKGFTVGTLSYGYVFGAQPQLFGDLHFTSADATFGVVGQFAPVAPTAFSAGLWGVYYATPNIALRVGSDSSWTVSTSQRSGLNLTVSDSGPAVAFESRMEDWQLVGTVAWRAGIPQMTVTLLYSTSWLVGK